MVHSRKLAGRQHRNAAIPLLASRPRTRKEVTATRLPTRIRDWLEQRLPPRLVGIIDWPAYRLTGRCWAESCGRLMVTHTPRQLRRCERTH